ncbi:MAG: Tab2 family RNA-binding protein, partial [Nostocaceae cyanobacterium]|nr:Tab2 family RNA-binding protein [Nostocaceae cyanobacterium]
AQQSRRTLVLNQWLTERMEDVYPQEPGYQGGTNPSVRLEGPLPQRLPDALEGQQWGFVSLKTAELEEMPEWDISFGEGFPLKLAQVDPDTPIPGVLMFSPRALPLAAWMSGLELATLKVDTSQGTRLLLETGGSESWILANLRDPQILKRATDFEQAKQNANGLNFIGVQSNPESESFAGFWLLQDILLP